MQAITNRLVEPAKLLLIVGIAYTLASTAWYFISPPTPAPLTDGTASRSQRPAVALDLILAANLFGRADATQGQAPSAADAPATNLRLTLEGVFHAGDPQNSAAIISEQGRPGELYHVGQRVSGNAELAEVLADRVVLKRGAVMETLRFPEETALLASGVADEPNLPTADTPADEPVYQEAIESPPSEGGDSPQTLMQNEANPVRSSIEQYRTRLEADPAAALSQIGVSAVSQNSASGYQLGSLANSPYLAQTGLQPGDVVLSVNGRPVGNMQQDRLELDNIMAQGSARLEVQRGERRFFVTASLK